MLTSALALAVPVMASAQSPVSIAVNGVSVNSAANYLSDEGKSYLDVDAFVAVTGVAYTYDEAAKTITINGKTIEAEVKDGKKLALVRSVAEAAGASGVQWEGSTRTVNIQYDKQLSVYGDVVSQNAGCALQNRFAAGDAIIFRMKATNPITGQLEQNAKMQVHLSTGEVLDMRLGNHSPEGMPEELFWTARYDVTAGTPKGTLNYSVTAETPTAKGEFRPFNIMPSLITIVSDEAPAGPPADSAASQ